MKALVVHCRQHRYQRLLFQKRPFHIGFCQLSQIGGNGTLRGISNSQEEFVEDVVGDHQFFFGCKQLALDLDGVFPRSGDA